MSIIFGPLKTLPMSLCYDCVTFRVLKYLHSTFLLYTPHCHMILSKQNRCLWSTDISTESQKRTSVLQSRKDALATRKDSYKCRSRAELYIEQQKKRPAYIFLSDLQLKYQKIYFD